MTIEVTIDMATEFYLGMYAVDDEHTYDTCWLKRSSDGWRISIGSLNLCLGITKSVLPYFCPQPGTTFQTKESALYWFSKGERQDRNEIVVSADLTEHYNSMVSVYAYGVYTEL